MCYPSTLSLINDISYVTGKKSFWLTIIGQCRHLWTTCVLTFSEHAQFWDHGSKSQRENAYILLSYNCVFEWNNVRIKLKKKTYIPANIGNTDQ